MHFLIYALVGVAGATMDVDNVRFEPVDQRSVDTYTARAKQNANVTMLRELHREKRNYKTIDESNTKLSADAPWRHDGKCTRVHCAPMGLFSLCSSSDGLMIL